MITPQEGLDGDVTISVSISISKKCQNLYRTTNLREGRLSVSMEWGARAKHFLLTKIFNNNNVYFLYCAV